MRASAGPEGGRGGQERQLNDRGLQETGWEGGRVSCGPRGAPWAWLQAPAGSAPMTPQHPGLQAGRTTAQAARPRWVGLGPTSQVIDNLLPFSASAPTWTFGPWIVLEACGQRSPLGCSRRRTRGPFSSGEGKWYASVGVLRQGRRGIVPTGWGLPEQRSRAWPPESDRSGFEAPWSSPLAELCTTLGWCSVVKRTSVSTEPRLLS